MERKELSWKERGRLWFRLSIRGIVGVIVALLIIKFGKTVISLFMPFILALLLAMAINPLILKIQSRVMDTIEYNSNRSNRAIEWLGGTVQWVPTINTES